MKNRNLTNIDKALMVIGLFSTSLPFIIKHYATISDSVQGLITGFGIGIMIFVLIRTRKKPVSC
jgi:hypothetical protein